MLDSLIPWFHLKSVPGVGSLLFKRLLDRFHSPKHVLQASIAELLQVEGVSRRLAATIRGFQTPANVNAELELLAKTGYRVVTMTEADYPQLLREIPDPPPFLYVYGRLSSSADKIAVVGSRNATGYGVTTTRNLCADLATLGITIVSGMARGIDSAAHEGTLSVRGTTIAVLGSGLARVYPLENMRLFHRIAEQGAVVSEFALMTDPDAHNFPTRNRIISGMSLGTVVVEATKKSGSLITARLAAEQNREVFAVPGSVQSFKSTGTHTLIKQGAKLVENAQDILEELSTRVRLGRPREDIAPKTSHVHYPSLNEDEAEVCRQLGPYPIHIDDLLKKITLETGKLLSILLRLELRGIVQQSPGKLFCLAQDRDAK
jgi:DNA processing protein